MSLASGSRRSGSIGPYPNTSSRTNWIIASRSNTSCRSGYWRYNCSARYVELLPDLALGELRRPCRDRPRRRGRRAGGSAGSRPGRARRRARPESRSGRRCGSVRGDRGHGRTSRRASRSARSRPAFQLLTGLIIISVALLARRRRSVRARHRTRGLLEENDPPGQPEVGPVPAHAQRRTSRQGQAPDHEGPAVGAPSRRASAAPTWCKSPRRERRPEPGCPRCSWSPCFAAAGRTTPR